MHRHTHHARMAALRMAALREAALREAALREVAAAADRLTILRNHRGRPVGLACGPRQVAALADALAALAALDDAAGLAPAEPAELPPGATLGSSSANIVALAGLGDVLARLASLPLRHLAELVGTLEDRAAGLAPAAPAELPPGPALGPLPADCKASPLHVADLGMGLHEVREPEDCDACGEAMRDGAATWTGTRMLCPACALVLLRPNMPRMVSPSPADTMRQGHA